MKNKKNYLIVFAIAGLIFGLAQVTTAQPGQAYNRFDRQWKGHGQRMSERHLFIPDLTEDQKEQIKDLRIAHLKDVQPIKSELKINKAKLNALMIGNDPDLKEVNKLIEESGNMRIEMQKKAAAHKLEIRGLLSDEQKVFIDSHPGRSRMKPQGLNGRNYKF